MNKEFFEAVALLESEKGIPSEYMFEKLFTNRKNCATIKVQRRSENHSDRDKA